MVVLSLGLAIGATTAVFSFVDAVLLRPFPYRDAERLVLLWASKTKLVTRGISGPDLEDLHAQNRVFEDIVPYVGYSGEPLDFGVDNSGKVSGFYAGAGFFSLLAVRPYLGRVFRFDEDQPGAEKVAVLSYSFWQNQLGGKRDVVGRTITLSREPYTVIGVMPPQFFFPDQTVQVWLPILASQIPPERGSPMVHALARLKPGVTLAQGQSAVDTIVHRLASAYPETDKNLSIGLFPALNEIVGNYRAAFWSLFGGMALLLLIACANIAHLVLARGIRRGTEISVRVSLGATRGAIFRQLLVESLLLGVAGGLVGIFIAFWGVRILLRLGLTDIPRFTESGVDHRVLLFGLGVSLLTGVSLGALPAWRVSRPNLVESLKQGGTAYSYGAHSRLRDLLMVSEIAFAFVLMAGAGLLINSFIRLARLDWGFRPDHILVVDVESPRSSWYDIPQNTTFAEQVISRLEAFPGVLSASVARGSPITHWMGAAGPMTLNGRTVDTWEGVVGPGYFRTLGIPLFHGREFTESDNSQAPKVVVVDKSLAEQLWPGEDPVGKRLTVPVLKLEVSEKVKKLPRSAHAEAMRLYEDPNSYEHIPYDVVGEVGAVRTFGLLSLNYSSIYFDYRQRPAEIGMFGASFFLHTSTEPSALAKAARAAIQEAQSGVIINDTETLTQRVTAAIGGRGSNKLLVLVGSVTSGLGLLLAALGIYGVLAFTTAQRTHEIGVRLALGAQRGVVFRMILGRGLLLTIAGLLFGLVGALATTKMLAGYLFGVGPADAVTFAEAALLFLLVAFLACYWPAHGAMKLEPLSALRYE
jgi:putative ABC transport system permease protein